MSFYLNHFKYCYLNKLIFTALKMIHIINGRLRPWSLMSVQPSLTSSTVFTMLYHRSTCTSPVPHAAFNDSSCAILILKSEFELFFRHFQTEDIVRERERARERGQRWRDMVEIWGVGEDKPKDNSDKTCINDAPQWEETVGKWEGEVKWVI